MPDSPDPQFPQADEGLGAFLMATAWAVAQLDALPPNERCPESFLEAIRTQIENPMAGDIPSADAREKARMLRAGLLEMVRVCRHLAGTKRL